MSLNTIIIPRIEKLGTASTCRKRQLFGFKQPLVGEKRCVTTLITAEEKTSCLVVVVFLFFFTFYLLARPTIKLSKFLFSFHLKMMTWSHRNVV